MKRLYILSILLIVLNNLTYSQTDRQFWFVAPEVTYSHTGADTPIYLRITAGALGADVTISMPANLANFATINQNIPPNTTVTVNLSARKTQVENTYDNLDGVPGKSNKGIYIESTNPITVYYEVSMTNNCDIFPLKGLNALGTEFWSIFQTKGYNMTQSGWAVQATSSIDIVATEDGTVVTIESPLASQDLYFYGTGNVNINLNKGETFSITPKWNTKVPTGGGCALQGPFACDIFGRAAADHLSGLRITSNAGHPIAITKKDDSVRYNCVDGWTGGCYDLMGEQYVPLDILGLEYIAMRGGLTTAPENVYVVATEDNTNIYINGNAVAAATINRGQTYICESLWNPGSNFVHIRGDKKISVMHVSGFGCEVGAAILPPTDKCTGSTTVSVTRSTNEGFFFNLMVWSGAEDGFYINGVLQDDSPGTLFGPADFVAVPGSTNWKIWRSPNLPTATFPVLGVFTFENTEDVFHLGLINGGSSSGCRFGYFSDFNELRVDAQATGSLSSSIRACSYEKIQLYAQGGTDYNWWPIEYLDDPTSSTPLSDPPADTIMLFYVEVSGACGLTDTATVSVEKFPELESQFSIDKGFGCSPLELAIHEISTQVKELFWDFNYSNIGIIIDRDTTIIPGINNIDTDNEFTHLFTNTSNEPIDSAQNYIIRLLAKNTNDCSDTAWASVNVYPEVTADFSISVPADTIGCSPHFVQFANNSNNEDAYNWQFGDGVSNFAANPPHTFYNILNSDTIYTTRLVARSNYFCRDTFYMTFTVHPYIENGFTINKHEGCSPLDVTFTNGSVFADTIFLDFGDGNDTTMTSFTTVIHRYTNTSNTVDTNVVEMIVKNDEGCYEFAYDTIIVYPRVQANYTVDVATYTGCNSQLFNFVNTSNSGVHTASSYLWTFGDGTNSNTTAVNVPHTYTNSTSADQDYTFNLRAQSQYGCWDDTTHNIRINRAYANFVVNTDEGCSQLPVTITNTSVGTGITTWAWDFGDATNSALQNPPIKTYTNATGATQVRNMQLTVTGTGGCSTSKTIPISVYSSVDITFTPLTQTGCDSLVIPFNSTIVPNIAGTTYAWDFGDGTSSSAADITHIYRNLTSAANVTYTAQVTATTPNGCTDNASTTITVRPYVNALFTVDKVAGCSPLTVDPVATSYIGINQYSWDFGDGTPLVMGVNPSAHTYPANITGADITYTLRLDVFDPSGLCTEFMEKTITVYSEANADFNPKNSSNCNPYTVIFDNLSFNISSSIWDFDDNGATSNQFEPTYIFTNSTSLTKTYNVELDITSNRGCTDTYTSAVNVYPYINADFNVDVVEGCSPLTITISNLSTGPSLSYSWIFPGGVPATSTVANPGSIVFSNGTGATVTRQISLTITGSGGCTSVKTMDIDVFSEITVSFSNIPDPLTICDSSTVTFTPSLTPLVGSTTYSWNFGDGTSGSSTGILDQTHLYRNLNSASSATYPVSVLAETPEGCIDMATKNVTVRPYVKSKFTIDNVAGCSPTFAVDAVAVSLPGISQYLWNFGDTYTTTGQNPTSHTYPANTTGSDVPYTITLEVRDPSGTCNSISTKGVTSYSENTANFTPQNVSDCNPYIVSFINNSFNSATYLWNFGDGTTSNLTTPPAKTFTNTTNVLKTYNVNLLATSNRGCTHDTTATINVYRFVNADFAVNTVEGCSPVTVTITNNSSGGTYRWYWNSQTAAGAADYTSTNSTESIPHTYTNTSSNDIIFYLTVIAENSSGCTDTLTKEILIHSSITANFTFVQNNACNPSNIVFTNTSIGGGSYTMNWDFGDGTSQATTSNTVNKTLTNTTTNDKNFTVIMSAESENGCTDTYQDIVTVYSRVEANFSIPISQGCPDPATELFNATIKNISIGNASNTYQWYIDNVAIPTAPIDESDFVYNYQNGNPSILEYEVRLRATNPHGCYSEKLDTITVFEYVDALFVPLNPTGCTPWDVDFDNQSTAPATNTNYLWSFGDNTSSGEFEPKHKFYNSSRTTDKSYRILLTVTSENYCIDTVSEPILVYHQPLAKLYADPTSSCPPLVVTMNNFDSRGFDRFEWRFGDGVNQLVNSSVGASRNYSYPNPSIDITYNYTLKLWVETDEGCWHMDSTQLNVFPDVIADFTYDPAGCSPFVAEFINTSSSPATQFFYDFKDGGTDNQPNVFHRFVNNSYFDQIYQVKLTASSEYNCWDTISKPVTVYAQPVALFNPTPTVQTFPENQVQLNGASNNQPWNYTWDFDDGTPNSSSPNELYHTYEHWGERDITLTLQSTTSSCNNTITKTIIIYPPAVNAAFTVSTDRGCEPLDVQFTAAASTYTEIYTYEWDFGDGTSETGATPNHTYENAGLYYVKMVARGEGGEDYEYRTIKVYKNPVANFSVAPKLGMLNEQLQARVEYFNQSECSDTLGCTYLWDFGDNNTSTDREGIHNYTELGTYDISLKVTTSQGCVDSTLKEDEVTIIGEGQIVFPNAFTPNIDGPIGCRTDDGYDIYSNDIFFPVYKGVVKYELLIYTRWGELIFKSNDVDCGWDGYVDGKLAKQDVYVWKAQGKFTNGRVFEIAGDVTLIR